MLNPHPIAREGDVIILYATYDNVFFLTLKRDAIYNCRWGHYHHNDLIGVHFGTKVYARKPMDKRRTVGFMYMLWPTPELWTHALDHRTQIMYLGDISMILLRLNIKPGATVVESGTGTGSLSTSIARCVAPNGHLYTFEFNEFRSKAARDDFKLNSINEYITVECRNVCADGFPDALDGRADAVFLDLPNPWEGIKHAEKVLRGNGRICTFSPCIEQVIRSAAELRECGFLDIGTTECLLRPHDVKRISLPEHVGSGKLGKRERDDDIEKESMEEDRNTGDDSKRIKGKEGEGVEVSSLSTRKVTSLSFVATRPSSQGKGHSGFLTFARKPIPHCTT